ncbi:MAG: hypothetical protein A2017_07225 [Lentisphaerae bacterium GWF2_44_16]|nr:MAG: hypothetical protein A2017_07225 [Lentisphaerae bacterium GWF2_44_16]
MQEEKEKNLEMSTPVYQQIKDVIREEIKQGKYKPGDILPSVNQLAVMFSTSRNTAVKAVSDLAHDGIIYCVQGKGSVVSDLRKETKVRKTKNINKTSVPGIGILLADFDDINHPYMSKILKGISLKAKTTPCNLKTFCISNYSIPNFIRTENFHGLIVLTELPQSSVFLLKQHKIPFVLVNNDIYGEDISCVTVDSFSATYEAIKYFHALGHRKISVLTGPYYARSTAISHAAYMRAMSDLGLEADEGFFRACDWGENGGYATFSEMLNAKKIPTAVFALEDHIAVGAMRAAEEKSLKVPSDLSIIGTGDMLPNSNVKVPLTTFDSKLEELGGVSLELTCRQLRSVTIENSKINLKPKMVIRGSCALRRA